MATDPRYCKQWKDEATDGRIARETQKETSQFSRGLGWTLMRWQFDVLQRFTWHKYTILGFRCCSCRRRLSWIVLNFNFSLCFYALCKIVWRVPSAVHLRKNRLQLLLIFWRMRRKCHQKTDDDRFKFTTTNGIIDSRCQSHLGSSNDSIVVRPSSAHNLRRNICLACAERARLVVRDH